MNSTANPNIFVNRGKFGKHEVEEIRSKVVRLQELKTTDDLEIIVPFNEIGRLPRRDAIVWFSMYSLAIANKYNEYDSRGHVQIASLKALVAYLNRNCQVIDENFVFASDIYYLLRNRLFLFKLNGIFRRLYQETDHKRAAKWANKIPFSEEQDQLLSLLQEPNTIIKEIAYWSYKTNYTVTLKYVYFIDRMSRRINQIIKKYEHKFQPFSFFGLRKVTPLQNQFYEEISPILSDFFDFYRELCPLDDRILPRIKENSENIPEFIPIIHRSRSALRRYLLEEGRIYDLDHLADQIQILDSPPIQVKTFIKQKRRLQLDPQYISLKERYFKDFLINGFRIRDIITEMEELYRNEDFYLFQGGKTVLVLCEFLEEFINNFIRLYTRLMLDDHKISFFPRLFEETADKILINKEIRKSHRILHLSRPIIYQQKFWSLLKTKFSDIKFINRQSYLELDKLSKQIVEYSLIQLAESKKAGQQQFSDEKFLEQTIHSLYS